MVYVCVREASVCLGNRFSVDWENLLAVSLTPKAAYLAEILDAVQRRGHVKKDFSC